MKSVRSQLIVGAVALCLLESAGCAQPAAKPSRRSAAESWTFAVSGDSRNCGNLVMPAIAAGARRDHAAFYWHLGDVRAISRVDEDYARELRFKTYATPPILIDYLHTAWTDFSQHQVKAFGDMPFFLGIGNHETIAPKSRNQFLIEFEALLDLPQLQRQREHDAPLFDSIGQAAAPRTYFHWNEGGVDFISLDNATDDAFDTAQLAWLDAVLEVDRNEPAVKALVVGMHESLPYSKSDSHSMCGSLSGRESGTHVYEKLAQIHKLKPVYVLSSHSHYYLADNFATEHWRTRDSVLPGWVVGTAGAERYSLPDGVSAGADAREHVYGYLLGTVKKDGAIDFTFREFAEADLLAVLGPDYTTGDVHFCFTQNPDPEKLRAAQRHAVSCENAHTH